MLGPLKFRESAYEGRDVGFMIFTTKLGFVPSSEGSFHVEVEEATTRVSLESSASDNHSVIGTQLIFQKKVMLEQRIACRDS
jgi:hypothetical protein